MALYADSTQARNWLLTPETVNHERQVCYERLSTLISEDIATSWTLEDETAILLHHRRRILRLLTSLRFPHKVQATAITYFTRFYLRRSVLEYNPSVISLLSVYAASKVEEVIITADDLVYRADRVLNGVEKEEAINSRSSGNGTFVDLDSIDGTAVRVSSDVLLGEELGFLQMLDFHLICYHGYRSIDYVGKEMNIEEDVLVKAVAKINEVVLLTDMILTHTPAVVALAVLQLSGVDVNTFVNDGEGQKRVMEACSLIKREEERLKGNEGNVENVTKLERRRRKMRIGKQDPCSEEGQRFKEETEQRLEDERLERDRAMELERKKQEEDLLSGKRFSTGGDVQMRSSEAGVAKRLRMSLSGDG
eukprot:Plantae.Rhodophyta-Hildenbrandia_rubra.ctg7596.p1 GENE.Plantae.Rhodophyta-Hildenbrandia_rubra.ctg7596~~Plantae.Rhodophyta-Hildenbrandia_rubra.ctg7596.p1  ORF type:complete len:364 (-),score=85.95 Plantae.Rhodophyta-Hildenbrandia_rubra.ctg7596:477-1568(-)